MIGLALDAARGDNVNAVPRRIIKIYNKHPKEILFIFAPLATLVRRTNAQKGTGPR
jgi:hypothetical protein